MKRALWVAMALGLMPQAALSHAYLEKAVPAQRAMLFTAPGRVQLWFNERLEAAFCSITVIDDGGKAVDQGDMRVAPENPKLMSVGLNPLAAGVYTVKFRVLSIDGHVVTSQFSFTVRESR